MLLEIDGPAPMHTWLLGNSKLPTHAKSEAETGVSQRGALKNNDANSECARPLENNILSVPTRSSTDGIDPH